MFESWFKNKKQKQPKEEKEYTLIWYKQMVIKDKVLSRSKPFRTKVKASSYEEAKNKLETMVLGKTEIKITTEENLDGKFNQINKKFDEIFERVDHLFKEIF